MPITARLTELPPWLAAMILIGIMVPVAIMSFLIVHRSIPVKIRKLHNDVAGFLYATAGIAYGVLLAFLVVVVWEQFNEVEINVENESSIALLLASNIKIYPDVQKSMRMKEALLEYTRLALQEHKELTADIGAADNDRIAINGPGQELLKIAQEIIAQNPGYPILDSEILKNLSELVKYRNLRLQAMWSSLPDSMWLAIIVGGIIMIGFTFFFGTENVQAHILMIAMITTSIAVVIYVVIELEYPFIGYTVVDPPQWYERLLAEAHAW